MDEAHSLFFSFDKHNTHNMCLSYLCLDCKSDSWRLRLGLLGMTILGSDSTAMPLLVLRSSTPWPPWSSSVESVESCDAEAAESNFFFQRKKEKKGLKFGQKVALLIRVGIEQWRGEQDRERLRSGATDTPGKLFKMRWDETKVFGKDCSQRMMEEDLIILNLDLDTHPLFFYLFS